MGEETPSPSGSAPPQGGERSPAERLGEGSSQERYGPLQVVRARKDDGRALLLFSLVEEPR